MKTEASWSRLTTQLAEVAPSALDSLRPPASEDALEVANSTLGGELSPGFLALYGAHDGQEGQRAALFDRHRFLPLSEGLRLHAAFVGAEGVDWSPSWWPLAARDSGDYLALDLRDDTLRRYGPTQQARIERRPGWCTFRHRDEPDVGPDALPPLVHYFDTARDQMIAMDYDAKEQNFKNTRLVEWGVGHPVLAMLERLATELEEGDVVWSEDYGLLPTLWLDGLEEAEAASHEANPLKRLRKLYQRTPKALRQLRDMGKRQRDSGAGHMRGVALAALGRTEQAIEVLETWEAEYPGSVVAYTREGVTTETRTPNASEPLVRALLADLRTRLPAGVNHQPPSSASDSLPGRLRQFAPPHA